MIHYSPNVPAFLKAPVRARLEESVGHAGRRRQRRQRRGRSPSSPTVRRGGGARCSSSRWAPASAAGSSPAVGCCAARTASRPRSVTSRSIPTGRGARAGARSLGGGGLGHRARRARARPGGGRAAAVGAGERGRRPGRRLEGTHVGDAAAGGRPRRGRRWSREYAARVALGLVGLVNIFDPELVVVSGGLVELDDVLLGPLREAFDGRIEGARYRPAGADRRRRARRRCRASSAPRCWRGTCCEHAGEGRHHAARRSATRSSPRSRSRPRPRRSGLDGVFAYDHLFRRARRRQPSARARDVRADGRGRRRDDAAVAVGSLVAARDAASARDARATASTRSHASSAPTGCSSRSARATAESREENESFGLEFGTVADRVAALRDAVDDGTRPRLPGLGGRHAIPPCARSRPRTPTAGTGGARALERFREQGVEPAAAAARSPFTLSWGGLVVLGATTTTPPPRRRERLGAGDRRDRRRARARRRRAAGVRRRRRRVADRSVRSTRRTPRTRGSSARRSSPRLRRGG